MKKRHKNTRGADLRFCQAWLGLGPVKKREVFIAAANALEVSHPATVHDGYELLNRFHQEFRYSHSQAMANTLERRATRKSKERAWNDANSDEFLLSYEWRRLRMAVLVKRGARCECCGATPKDGIRIHVDHIKPRRRYPELALVESNLQVLCEVCNHGKGSWDDTDWRAASQSSGESSADSHVTRSGDGDGQTPSTAFPRLIRRTQEMRGNVSGQDKAKGIA